MDVPAGRKTCPRYGVGIETLVGIYGEGIALGGFQSWLTAPVRLDRPRRGLAESSSLDCLGASVSTLRPPPHPLFHFIRLLGLAVDRCYTAHSFFHAPLRNSSTSLLLSGVLPGRSERSAIPYIFAAKAGIRGCGSQRDKDGRIAAARAQGAPRPQNSERLPRELSGREEQRRSAVAHRGAEEPTQQLLVAAR